MLEEALKNNFSYHKSSIRDLEIDIMIGIMDWEKKPGAKQKIIIDIDTYRLAGKFRGDDIKDCMNYAAAFEYITKNWADRNHVDLLETLIEELMAFCFRHSPIDACRIAIRKPVVFGGQAVPCVEFFRVKKDMEK